jgi:hypothetical protein
VSIVFAWFHLNDFNIDMTNMNPDKPSIKREREMIDPELVSSLHEKPSEARKVKSEEDKSSTGKRWTPEQVDGNMQYIIK